MPFFLLASKAGQPSRSDILVILKTASTRYHLSVSYPPSSSSGLPFAFLFGVFFSFSFSPLASLLPPQTSNPAPPTYWLSEPANRHQEDSLTLLCSLFEAGHGLDVQCAFPSQDVHLAHLLTDIQSYTHMRTQIRACVSESVMCVNLRCEVRIRYERPARQVSAV